MRKKILVLIFLLFSALFFWSILQKEELLSHGETIRLRLAPADPRSLMQGDYMALRYALERELEDIDHRKSIPSHAAAVIRIDKDKVAGFVRIYRAKEPLAEDERLLYFSNIGHGDFVQVRLRTSHEWFFQEGKAKELANAKYGEFRINKKGETLLGALLDNNFQILDTSR